MYTRKCRKKLLVVAGQYLSNERWRLGDDILYSFTGHVGIGALQENHRCAEETLDVYTIRLRRLLFGRWPAAVHFSPTPSSSPLTFSLVKLPFETLKIHASSVPNHYSYVADDAARRKSKSRKNNIHDRVCRVCVCVL